MAKEKAKDFKYWRFCKYPLCPDYSKSTGNKFGTNRKWQDFCCPEHQQKWHKYLRRKREEMIVEFEMLKDEFKEALKKLEESKTRFRKVLNWLHKEFQLGGTPIEINEKIKAIEKEIIQLKRSKNE